MHVYYVIDKAWKMCNLIFRSFAYCEPKVVADLYKVYVRPIIVDYCCVVYSPNILYLINLLENVQKYFTRRACKNYNLSYLQRLDTLNLKPCSWN